MNLVAGLSLISILGYSSTYEMGHVTTSVSPVIAKKVSLTSLNLGPSQVLPHTSSCNLTEGRFPGTTGIPAIQVDSSSTTYNKSITRLNQPSFQASMIATAATSRMAVHGIGSLALRRPCFSIIGRRSLATLAVLEQRDGQLNHGSLNSISAARSLGKPVHGFIAGKNVSGAANEAARIDGVEKVLVVDNEAYEKVWRSICIFPISVVNYLFSDTSFNAQGLAENFATLLAENIRKGRYTHVFASHGAFGKSVMPRVAALLDLQPISDVVEVKDEKTFIRPIYAGNAIATVQSTDPIKVITIRGTAFPAAAVSCETAVIEQGADPKEGAYTKWISEELTKSDRPELSTASKVVSGGRGLKSKADFDNVILPLADTLGAAVGASRAAVDSGYADNSLQVGQTGKVVAPQLYMAVGISGAIQHLAGMKDSKVIAAINKDADAPIFQVADVGLVGDLFQAIPEFTEKLKQ